MPAREGAANILESVTILRQSSEIYQFVDDTPLKVVVTLISEVKLVPLATEVRTNSLYSFVPVFLKSLQLAERAFLSQTPVRVLTLSTSMWLIALSFYLRRVKIVLVLTSS